MASTSKNSAANPAIHRTSAISRTGRELKRLRATATAIVIVAALASCASQVHPTQPQMTGADRDEHGCIGSAGYSWCARERACVRSWELSAEKGFERSEEAFRRYCQESPQ